MPEFKATMVVPTIREDRIKTFLEAWQDQFKDHRVIVVFDGQEVPKGFPSYPWLEVACWLDIDTSLDDDAWLISKRSSAVRNFGTLKALEQDTDFIWHLDDDCLPSDGNELTTHYTNLYQPLQEERWLTTDKNGHRVRGIPYRSTATTPKVVVSHGTWLKNPDYDALHQLANPFEFEPDTGLVPIGKYFPMCGMNLAFKPEVSAAMYFAPSSATYNRNDDIWMGIIAKKVFDHLSLRCCTGYPQIVHDRASDPFANLIAEAPFIAANEGLWQQIDGYTLNQWDVAGCMDNIADQMMVQPYRDESYFATYGQALELWVERTSRGKRGEMHADESVFPSDGEHSAEDDKVKERLLFPSSAR